MVWGSAMDLQMKLVNDGYARSWDLTDASHSAKWSVWRDQAFGITAQPILFAYNARRIKAGDVPTSRSALRGSWSAMPRRCTDASRPMIRTKAAADYCSSRRMSRSPRTPGTW